METNTFQVQASLHNQPTSWQFRMLRALFGLRLMLHKSSVQADEETYIARKRASEGRAARYFKPIAPIECEPVIVNNCAAEWIVSSVGNALNATKPTILYLHGGSFTGGSIVSHRSLCGNIAHLAQARVLLVEYRLAPKHPFPAALDDAAATYRWLLESGTEPKNIVIAGDSSGGGLALSTLVALRDSGAPLPRAAVCLSAITDLACNSTTWDTNAQYEVVASVASARRSIEIYLNGTDPHTPLASPLYANLAGLPPILLQVGSHEVLLDDASRFAHKAREAGVQVTLDLWPEMVHSWQFAGQFLPEARAALERAAEFIRRSQE